MCFGLLLWGGIGGEQIKKVFRIQKKAIRIMVGINSRTSCREIFKELNILTLPSLYILEVTCWKYCKYLELNRFIHNHNTRRQKDIHIKSCKTEMYKKSVINMGTKIYNNLPGFIKEIEKYKAFKRELQKFLLFHTFYSVEEFLYQWS